MKSGSHEHWAWEAGEVEFQEEEKKELTDQQRFEIVADAADALDKIVERLGKRQLGSFPMSKTEVAKLYRQLRALSGEFDKIFEL